MAVWNRFCSVNSSFLYRLFSQLRSSYIKPVKMLKSKIEAVIHESVVSVMKECKLPQDRIPLVELYPLKNSNRGDYFSPVIKKLESIQHEMSLIQENKDDKNGLDTTVSRVLIENVERKFVELELNKLVTVCYENGFLNFTLIERESADAVRPIAEDVASKSADKMEVIGTLSSCFSEKHGTPRQGLKAPTTRGILKLRHDISVSSLDGLTDYSHIWLVFVFHGHICDSNMLKTKIRAPMLQGKKVGMFASRTPHRINPIGLSLVKLDKIESDLIYVSGIDLIDGTPIIDIKPYHPCEDLEGTFPQWVTEAEQLSVSWSDNGVISKLSDIVATKPLQFYKNSEFELFQKAIVDCLTLDPRSVHSKKSHADGIYCFSIDRVDVIFRMKSSSEAEIIHCEYCAPNIPREQTRTNAWLRRISSELGIEINQKYKLEDDEKNECD